MVYSHLLTHGYPVISVTFVGKTVIFPVNCFSTLAWNQMTINNLRVNLGDNIMASRLNFPL